MTESIRLESLETKLAFQEDTVTRLNDALIAQQARIDRLEGRLAMLAEQLQSGADDGGEASDQPPPHY